MSEPKGQLRLIPGEIDKGTAGVQICSDTKSLPKEQRWGEQNTQRSVHQSVCGGSAPPPCDDESSEMKTCPCLALMSSWGLKHPIQIPGSGSQRRCLSAPLANLITQMHAPKASRALAITTCLFTINKIHATIFYMWGKKTAHRKPASELQT